MIRFLPLALLVGVVSTVLTTSTNGHVTRLEIIERAPFAGGQSFGDVGPYEVIRGRLHYAVDPSHPRNQAVVDLHLAKEGRLRADLSMIENGRVVSRFGDDPRNERGEVEFAGDFLLLKPVDLARGNHRLLYEVNNRGLLGMLGYYNNARRSNRPSTAEHAGSGWLMRQGYSLLWSAWNWDVERVGQQPQRINLPVIVEPDGSPMTARIHAELEVQSRDGETVEWLAWGGSRCYPVVRSKAKDAVLTVRAEPDGPRTIIPRDDWQFATLDGSGTPRFDPVRVYLPGGFRKGMLYEVVYEARDPRVVGLGLTAIRDAISFFRFEPEDAHGTANPLAVNGTPDPAHAYIFGISQSGRVITHMIYQGFHVDEANRMVFDGARPHVAGGGKGSFNHRFAQTTHHPKHLQGNAYPADFFPFLYLPDGMTQHDLHGPPDRREGDLLAVAKTLGHVPHIVISNHEGEYWTRSASLVHTDVEGTTDATLHPNVRLYVVNASRHGYASRWGRRTSGTARHSINELDARPIGRALLVVLDAWVSRGVEPPANRVPRIDRGELITASEHRSQFPSIPAMSVGDRLEFPAPRHPGVNLNPPRSDYGPRFWTEGVQDVVPPQTYGPRFVTLVPAFDVDGNPLGGIRMPLLEVPLGTYQGFNPRRASIGAPNYLKAFDSSFWPFALTRAERLERGDDRRSIEERYPDKASYVRAVAEAVERLQEQRLLLEEDGAIIADQAARRAWPPRPTDRWPFWVESP